MNPGLAHRLSEFGRCFDAAKPIWDRRHGLHIKTLDDYRKLVNKPLDALMLFTTAAHERPYASPQFPIAHRLAIIKAIGASDIQEPNVNKKFSEKLLNYNNFPGQVWSEFKKLAKIEEKAANQATKESYTKGPVLKILDVLKAARQPNIILYLQSKKLKNAYEFLKDKNQIGGIGHKIAALFLRDIWDYVGKGGQWVNTPPTDKYCIQPVDRWVKMWAEKCWSDDWPQSVEKYAEPIIGRCKAEGVDPMNFNKGAWFVGSHFQNICSFCGVKASDRLSYTADIVDQFDPNKVEQAIKTLSSLEAGGQVFSVRS